MTQTRAPLPPRRGDGRSLAQPTHAERRPDNTLNAALGCAAAVALVVVVVLIAYLWTL
jgi:hypothetical protein